MDFLRLLFAVRLTLAFFLHYPCCLSICTTVLQIIPKWLAVSDATSLVFSISSFNISVIHPFLSSVLKLQLTRTGALMLVRAAQQLAFSSSILLLFTGAASVKLWFPSSLVKHSISHYRRAQIMSFGFVIYFGSYLNVHHQTTTLLCCEQIFFLIAWSPERWLSRGPSSRTKLNVIRVQYMRKLVAQNLISIVCICTADQPAGVLAKAPTRLRLVKFPTVMNLDVCTLLIISFLMNFGSFWTQLLTTAKCQPIVLLALCVAYVASFCVGTAGDYTKFGNLGSVGAV